MSLIKKNKNRAKRREKQIEKIFNFDNSQRKGIFGCEDVETEHFIIEVKTRKKFIFEKWFKQLTKNNKKNKVEIVIAIKKNQKIENSFVIIKLNDFLSIIKNK